MTERRLTDDFTSEQIADMLHGGNLDVSRMVFDFSDIENRMVGLDKRYRFLIFEHFISGKTSYEIAKAIGLSSIFIDYMINKAIDYMRLSDIGRKCLLVLGKPPTTYRGKWELLN